MSKVALVKPDYKNMKLIEDDPVGSPESIIPVMERTAALEAEAVARLQTRHLMNEHNKLKSTLRFSPRIPDPPYSFRGRTTMFTRPVKIGRQHKKPGTEERKYVCITCAKGFGYKHVLQNHVRTHTGEKPFACTHPGCEKRFTRDHHLKTHKRLHTGEKPYKCHLCGKKFVQIANLRRHHRVHLNEEQRYASTFKAYYTHFHNPAQLYSAPIDIPVQEEPEDLSVTSRIHWA